MTNIGTIDRQYQDVIAAPPRDPGGMYQQSTSSDEVTVKSWWHVWLENFRSNKARYGKLGDKSYGALHGINRNKPAIVIGSGPSLGESLEALKKSRDILSVSCLHNYGFFEDNGWHPDYYITLDAGAVVLDDMCEGKKTREEYYESSKGKKLLACSFTDPRLFDHWQGDVWIFNCLIPSVPFMQELHKIERFTHYISSGGNALGAAMYAAKGVMGSNPILYVGADFCFSYDKKFHAWDSKYDTLGSYIRAHDIYGNLRFTWQSYYNFKIWFDYIAWQKPGIWFNCSDGILGAYKEGNMMQYHYMSLNDALTQFLMNGVIFLDKVNAQGEKVERIEIDLGEMYANPEYERDIVFW